MPAPREEPGTPETASDSDSPAEASLHTASRSRRSALRTGRPGTRDAAREGAYRAAAPPPSDVSVRFQFVFIACLLRFPAVVPLFPAVPVFGSRFRRSGPLAAALRSGARQENRVLLSLRSGAVCAACFLCSAGLVRSAFRPARCMFRVRLEASGSDCPVRRSAVQFSFGTRSTSSPEVPGSPPGSGLLFRSFAVRFAHGLHLEVRVSVSFRLSRSSLLFGSVSLSCSFSARLFSVSVRFPVRRFRFLVRFRSF